MNVSGPSGNNYNPFRTENDKPTSSESITGMGQLSGDYGKTGNWFFRKAYDSVSALFTGKYWKGGWFSSKQSGNVGGSKDMNGRFASLPEEWKSDAEEAINMTSAKFRSENANEQLQNLDNRAAINERRVKEADSKIEQFETSLTALIQASEHPDIHDNSSEIRKEPKQLQSKLLTECNEELKALSSAKIAYDFKPEMVDKLKAHHLAYNSENNQISFVIESEKKN